MSIEKSNINIPSLTISEAKDAILMLYLNAIKRGIPLKKLPTPFFWGPPGVGKSESVYQFAEELGKKTGKKTVVQDVRLLLFSPVDLRGVPVADASREFTTWLKPQIFHMDDDLDVVNILFLDELSAAPQSVQAAAYQICLDRKIGEHKLPENCIVVAAGNRITDQSVSYKMPKALCNRLIHFDIKTDYASWRNWAIQNEISDKVIAYLAFDNTRLYVEPETSEIAYPTPRSWSFVSNLLMTTDNTPENIHTLIAGCIGESATIEFESFCRGVLDMPNVEEIIAGKCKDLPKKHDVLYALISNLVRIMKERCEDLSIEELDNILKYVMHFPKDFMMSFMTDVTSVDKLNKKLMKCRYFQMWVTKNKNTM